MCWRSLKFLVVPHLHLHALSVIEVLQVVNGVILVVQFACLVVDDFCAGQCFGDALQQRVLVSLGGRAAVVAVHQFHVVGVRSYYSESLDVFRERQHSVVVKQHHRLAGSLYGKVVMLLAAYYILAKFRPRKHVGGVEHTQFETSHQSLAQVAVKVFFLDKSLIQSFGEAHKHLSALEVGTVEHSVDACRERVAVCLVLSLVVEVVYSIAVGHYESVISPLVAQDIDEQSVAGAARTALEALVCTHHLAHVSLLHQSLECGEIGFPQVAVRRLHVHRVAQRLGTAVNGIVLCAGVGLDVIFVVALHS